MLLLACLTTISTPDHNVSASHYQGFFWCQQLAFPDVLVLKKWAFDTVKGSLQHIFPEGMVCFPNEKQAMGGNLSFSVRCYFVIKWPLELWRSWDHEKTSIKTRLITEDGRRKGKERRSLMTPLNPVTDWSVGQWEDRNIWQLGHKVWSKV